MGKRKSITDYEALLRTANETDRDGLRLALRPHLNAAAIEARTMGSIGGGELTHTLTIRLLDFGTLPTPAEMSGEGSDNWPHEFFGLIRYGDSFAPWQAFAAWVLLVWVADPADDEKATAEDETVFSLVEAARHISVPVCASAISFLRWHAPARNEHGPTAFHELGIACLYASIYRTLRGQQLLDALDGQCQHMIDVADRETLQAIDCREIYNIRWPLDITESLNEKDWRGLCNELLGHSETTPMPDSAAEILRRMKAGI